MVNQFTGHAPVGSQLKANRLYVTYLFMALPLLVHGWMVYRFSTNMPYLDDYTFLVDALNLKTAHLTAPQLLTAIFYPHGEHVIIFARLTALLDYAVAGELNFRTLFFAGNATLLGTAWLLYRIARQGGLSVLHTLPIVYLLFQPQYYENTMTWAICALQHVPALFFAFGTFYLLAQPSARSFAFSLPLAFLATFSNGNGLAVLVAGFLVVLLRRRAKYVRIWLLFSGLSGGLYYYLSQFSAAPVSENLTHPLRVLGGFFLMSGSMGLLVTRSLAGLSLLGIAITLLIAVVIGTTLLRYTGRAHWLERLPGRFGRAIHKWSVPTVEPVAIVLIGGYVYLAITLAGIAFARGQGWHYNLLLPRFIWFATVAVVVGYLLLMGWLRPTYRPMAGRVVLGFSLLFNGAAYYLTIDEIRTVQQSLSGDLHNWREDKRLITLPANKRSSDSFYATLLTAAVREGVYELPPARLNLNRLNQGATISRGALIERDSSFSLDERQYRYLTIAAGALPKYPFPVGEAYLLLRSGQHTFIWPINQGRTKLSQFLLTGHSPRHGPLAVVLTDLLPPADYQLGLCYSRNGHWTTVYGTQRLDNRAVQ